MATLWDQCEALARRLAPLMPLLRSYLLSLAVIGADETWWRLMDKKRNGGTNKKWWAWVLCADQAVYFELRPQRSSDVVVELLLEYGGKLMVDGHGAYMKGQKRGAKYTLVFCWAHVRRKFLVAEKSYPREAGAIMDLIDELFRVDREAARSVRRDLPSGRAARAPPDNAEPLVERRRRLREDRSVWVIKALACWATEMKVLPQSSIGRAVRYMVDHWKGLIRFLDDPLVPLSNNASERAVRGPVVGRKNFGGCKSERGMEVTALLYSLVESAKLCEVDPREYLREMALRSIRDQELVLPHVYAAQNDAISGS